jgi:CRISPR-associated protein Cas2
MSDSAVKTWLVAYDIRHPRRLRRVHRRLKREGLAAQHSAFCVQAASAGLDALLEHVRQEIDEHADDVRAYHVPAHCRVWQLGTQQWPEGIYLEGSAAVSQLLAVSSDMRDALPDEHPVQTS